jgi:CheY-like chemotaxis protein/anti-sigma regulatory factor (Ser/Thr protein kinase)
MARIVLDGAAMVGRLQDFARRRHDQPLGAVDLARVVAEAIDMARTELEQKTALGAAGVTVRDEVGALPAVRGDASELRHVLVNLLLNARDAMPRGGEVTVAGALEGDRVLITVSDRGSGIPREHLERIFDPFFTTKGGRGTGLGLSLAYGAMQRLGGSIRAANRDGGGAVFTLCFQRAEEMPEPVPEPAPAVVRHGARVLLIDDDHDNLEAMRLVLEAHGCAVDVADNGAAAVERVRAGERYDVVLCDVGMPNMSGWQVAERMRAAAPEMPFYLLTGWAKEIPDEDPRRATVSGVLGKPVAVGELERLLPAAI